MNSFEYNFQGIIKSYGTKIVIHDVRIKVSNALCTLLIGQNGAGKSTLLKIISGLEKPDSCLVRIEKKNHKWTRCKSRLLKNFMYLHQHPYMFDGTVKKNLQYLVKKDNKGLASIEEAVEWAGLQDIINHQANSLSGGEKQRVAIARAYLRNPRVVLLDEPTANLDSASKSRTLQLLKYFKESGTALIIASHDPDVFRDIQDERLQLDNGKLTNLDPRYKPEQKVAASRFKPEFVA